MTFLLMSFCEIHELFPKTLDPKSQGNKIKTQTFPEEECYSVVLNCMGGVTLQFFENIRPPFHFYYDPPTLRIFQKILPPPILFPPPNMQNEYHFFAPERFLWLKATWKYKFTQSSKMLTKKCQKHFVQWYNFFYCFTPHLIATSPILWVFWSKYHPLILYWPPQFYESLKIFCHRHF